MTRFSAVLATTILLASTDAGAQSSDDFISIPALTAVPLVIDAEVSSGTHHSGDRFPLHVAEDVKEGDRVLISAGSKGEGEVVHAARSKGGGRAGELILAARFVTVAGEQVRLRSFSGGSGKDRTGASTGVAVALSFIGMLVRGSELVLPAGTLVSAKTADDVLLPALGTARGATPPRADTLSSNTQETTP